MSLLVILTLVAVGLIVVALAVSLITILMLLRRTLFTLGTINVGLRAIAYRVAPLEQILTEINSELTRAQGALSAVLKRHSQQRDGKASDHTIQEMLR